MRATAHQRHEAILADAFDRGEVTVRDLSASLGASEATVRRDLHTLAERGELELVHGGGRPGAERRLLLSLEGPAERRGQARRRTPRRRPRRRRRPDLPRFRHDLLRDGQPSEAQARPERDRQLRPARPGTRQPEPRSDPPRRAIPPRTGWTRSAPLANAALDQLRGYAAFVGADGLSREFGLTAGDIDSAYMYRLAVENAREVNLIVDHSKFAAASLCRIVGWGTRDESHHRPTAVRRVGGVSRRARHTGRF